MNIVRGEFSAVLSGSCNHIYAIGGYNTIDGALKSVERYDVARSTWEFVAPMHQEKFMHGAHICLSSIIPEKNER
jgi:hypothetical protein